MGHTKLEMNSENNMHVTLEEDEVSKDLVVFISGVRQFRLTPRQARILATKLVKAVSRAEVRINLKDSHNLSRKLVT
jgi:hypothetical protein